MATYTLKRFSHPDVLRSIHPRYLLKLLAPYSAFLKRRGLKMPSNEKGKINHELLLKILLTPDADTPQELANALFYINEMATPAGMDALLEEPLEDLGETFQQQQTALFGEPTPADIAVRVWIHNRELLERKHAELNASSPRRFEFFQTWVDPVPPFDPPDEIKLRRLEESLEGIFQRRHRGGGVRVFAFPHEHDCLFLVRHGDPYRREGALQGNETSSVLYRPVRFDVVIYHPVTGTLRIHARTDWETSLYRNEFGKHLFGAMDYFPNLGRYTLDPLSSWDEGCLHCEDVNGIKQVHLIEVQHEWGGTYNEVEVHRATNLFAAFEKRHFQLLRNAKLVKATFSVRFFKDRSPRTVTIQPPNVAQYSRDQDSPLIDQWLAQRGFLHRPRKEHQEHEEAENLLQHT